MKLEHLTEGKILKYLAMFFMGLVLVTVLVVFVISDATVPMKNNYFLG